MSVQAWPRDATSWSSLAAAVEEAGFEALYVPDHPGLCPAPFVALAAAASATDRIRLGTCVLNAGVWEPLQLAMQVATLDLVSNGRAVLGVGAGHTPREWTAMGRPFPPAGERVERMIQLVDTTEALLAGQLVSHHGKHFTLVDASLTDPRPVQQRVPLLVGGNGNAVLRFGARRADIVGVTGLGRTLADGHRHAVDWSGPGLDRIAGIVNASAEESGHLPHVEALVQHVEITDDAAAAASRLAPMVAGATPEDLLDTPFVMDRDRGTDQGTSGSSPGSIRHRPIRGSSPGCRAGSAPHRRRVGLSGRGQTDLPLFDPHGPALRRR